VAIEFTDHSRNLPWERIPNWVLAWEILNVQADASGGCPKVREMEWSEIEIASRYGLFRLHDQERVRAEGCRFVFSAKREDASCQKMVRAKPYRN
jgi:hypothetical protein